MRKEKRGKTRLPAELGRKKRIAAFGQRWIGRGIQGQKNPKPISAFFAFPKILSFSYSAFGQEMFSLVSKVKAISDPTKTTAFLQGMLTKRAGFFIWRLISPP